MADRKSINKEEIEYLGVLARINLSEDELKSFVHEFERILDYVSTLSSLETGNVKPAYNIMKQKTVLRNDETSISMDRKELLSNAPDKTDSFFKVPKII